MANGAWIYNVISKSWQWFINGKAYDRKDLVPKPEAKLPRYDPGKPVKK